MPSGPALPVAAHEGPQPIAETIRSSYTKFEYRIPMRDGVRLFTSVYVPNDRTRKYPLLMLRTPYSVGPYDADRYRETLGPSEAFARDGFIFVYQDVRGKYMSEGTFVNMRPHVAKKKGRTDVDESTDTYDTIEWLLEHVEGHNGKVGLWGISYPGFYAHAGMIDSHPALAAVSPQAAIADWFWDDMHHHGAFILPLAFRFFSSFGKPRPEPTTEGAEGFEFETPDGYQFYLDIGPLKNLDEKFLKGEIEFWNHTVAHPNYDEFWQSRNIIPHLKNVRAAVLYVGGWFDTEDLYGPLKSYAAVEANNPGADNRIVMGPWPHGGWNRREGERLGTAEFGFKTSEWYREHVELPFFKQHLKGEGKADLPEALMFETGANRWRHFDEWPPPKLARRDLYLREGGALTWDAPEVEDDVYDDYPSDPAKPVPYTM
jgi:putative CocE/NonD family hydrolase